MRDAYQGAATDVETYSNDGLDTGASIAVVRADSPELVPPLVVSAAGLGLVAPIDDIETIGNVAPATTSPCAVGIVGDLTTDDVAKLVDSAWVGVAG